MVLWFEKVRRFWRRTTARLPSAVWLNAALVVLLVSGSVGVYLLISHEETAGAATARTAVAAQGTVVATVTGSGNIESSASTSVDFSASGAVTEIKVKAGDAVKAGQVLARIDSTAARQSLTNAQAAVTTAQAQYRLRLDGQTRVSGQQDQVNIAKAQQAVVTAQTTVKNAQAQLASDTTSSDAAISSAKTQLENDRTSLDSAVKNAQAQLASDTTIQDTAVANAKTQLENDRTAQDIAVSGAQTAVDSAKAACSTSSSGSSGFIEIANFSRLAVTANIAEADAKDLKLGQTATVTFSASSRTVRATVTEISPESTTSNNVVLYPVTVSLESVPEGTKLGATVSVSITTGSAENVLIVPSSAVNTTGGRSTVTVQQGEGGEVVEVEVGLAGDSGTEIKAGLSEGDVVVLGSTSSETGSSGVPARGGMPGGMGGMPGGMGGGGR
jgi:macrolide-specific efflux system membrane fusion protein